MSHNAMARAIEASGTKAKRLFGNIHGFGPDPGLGDYNVRPRRAGGDPHVL